MTTSPGDIEASDVDPDGVRTDIVDGLDSSGSPDFHHGDDSAAAHQAELRDEAVTGADGGPVDEADMAAADGLTASPDVAKNYEEALERGAHQTGEGAPEV